MSQPATNNVQQGDIKAHTQKLMKSVLIGVKESNSLPKQGDNYELLQSFPVFNQLLKVESKRTLDLLNRVCRAAGTKLMLTDDGRTDVDEKLDRLVDANDVMLEKVGNLLDEAEGLRRKEETLFVADQPSSSDIVTPWNKQLHDRSSSSSNLNKPNHSALTPTSGNLNASGSRKYPIGSFKALKGAKNVPKPQLQFQDCIDNSNQPLKLKLKYKHHAWSSGDGMNNRKQTKKMKVMVDDEEVTTAEDEIPIDQANRPTEHPYKLELEKFKPVEDSLAPIEVGNIKKPSPVSDSECILIDDQKGLQSLLNTLKKQKEIAVDLEHHSYRSYLGLTCLMQITVFRNGADVEVEDYIVDTLALWRDLHVLNEVFSDPNIVKILHGSNMDVQWLQRDFGIYIVNLFDTGQAMKLLRMGRYSLAHLIKHYVDVDLQKEYQLSDWRIRPLPDELMSYARNDTHWLLYCYQKLRNELYGKGGRKMVRQSFLNSVHICQIHYEKPIHSKDDYLALYHQSKQKLNNQQLFALQHLYNWRDRTARTEDESLHYVLPDHMLLQMALILPKELTGLLACCNPIPALVRQSQQELHRIILHAREKPLDIKRGLQQRTMALSKTKERSLIGHPHDFSHSRKDEEIKPMEARLKELKRIHVLDEPSSRTNDPLSLNLKFSATLSAFDDAQARENREKDLERIQQNIASIVETWVSPYEQYLLAEEAIKEKEAEQENDKQKNGDSTEMNENNELGEYSSLYPKQEQSDNTDQAVHETDIADQVDEAEGDDGEIDDEEEEEGEEQSAENGAGSKSNQQESAGRKRKKGRGARRRSDMLKRKLTADDNDEDGDEQEDEISLSSAKSADTSSSSAKSPKLFPASASGAAGANTKKKMKMEGVREYVDEEDDMTPTDIHKKKKPKRNKFGRVFDASLEASVTPVDYSAEKDSKMFNDPSSAKTSGVFDPVKDSSKGWHRGGRGGGGRGSGGRGGRGGRGGNNRGRFMEKMSKSLSWKTGGGSSGGKK